MPALAGSCACVRTSSVTAVMSTCDLAFVGARNTALQVGEGRDSSSLAGSNNLESVQQRHTLVSAPGAEALLVAENVNLVGLALHIEIMREFALESLGALPCSEVLADHGLGIHPCRHNSCS